MGLTVGVAGATGAVGVEVIKVLETSKLDVGELRLFSSARSAGSKQRAGRFGQVELEEFDLARARGCDVVFLAVGGDFSKEHARTICEGDDGAVVIDNSSAFRYADDVPLVIPEINGDKAKKAKLIANPNCTTAIALMAVAPIAKRLGLRRMIMSTYQAASGAGAAGMEELSSGMKEMLDEGKATNEVFAHPLPFNVIPHIDAFQENGYTKEEMKVTWETRKILGDDDVPVSCTAVRIPTLRAHAEAITMETEKSVDVSEVRELLSDSPGVKVADAPSDLEYPMPLTATGAYDVEVGRLRKNPVFGDNGLDLFVCGDQLLRGAALNAVLIAEECFA